MDDPATRHAAVMEFLPGRIAAKTGLAPEATEPVAIFEHDVLDSFAAHVAGLIARAR